MVCDNCRLQTGALVSLYSTSVSLNSGAMSLNSTLVSLFMARGGGGGTPIYGLYRYVPRDRVCFFRFSVLK